MAPDTRLDRQAIKYYCPTAMTLTRIIACSLDADRRQIDHPDVCTIYEVGRRHIVTQYIEA
jgi:hypothetical protein